MAKTRTRLTIGELGSGMKELNSQSDRGAAVIGVCLLDEVLKELLIEAMQVEDIKSLDSALFDGPVKPLSSFSAKIKLSQSLGLLELADAAALDKVRKIRNKFAHSLVPLTFNEENIAPVCDQLKAYLEDAPALYSDPEDSDQPSEENRTAFLHVVSHLCLKVMNDGIRAAQAIQDAVLASKSNE